MAELVVVESEGYCIGYPLPRKGKGKRKPCLYKGALGDGLCPKCWDVECGRMVEHAGRRGGWADTKMAQRAS